jgi:hypothetical protein
MTLKTIATGLLVAVSVVACASGGAAGTPGPEEGTGAAQQSPSTRDRDLITRAELAAPDTRARSLMDVVKSTRPHFLSVRGLQSYKCGRSADECAADPDAGPVHVSVDNGRIVPLQELETIHAGTVQEVRFLNAAQAMQKFGGAARAGPVILVTMAK